MKILSYLNETKSFGITYVRGSGLRLEVYTNADYADNANVVSLSTSETEYIAAGDGIKYLFCLRAVLSFIAPETGGRRIKVLEDNQGTKALIENPLSFARSKHIDVRFHFIRNIFRTRKISVEYVASAEQYADILTKTLRRANFLYHRKRWMNLSE